MTEASTKAKVAVALDTTDRSGFLHAFESLSELPLVFKIGLKMLPRLEYADWKLFGNREIFVDAKLHDIPSQVADAVRAYGDLGANFLTVHLSGGGPMLEAALQAAQPYDLRLLGVSVLTSLHDHDLEMMGLAPAADTVERLLGIGVAAGLDSFVMSAHEVQRSKLRYPHIYCVTPGISLDTESKQDDQVRVSTIDEALAAGSNMLVIGRAILHSPQPIKAAGQALKSVERHK